MATGGPGRTFTNILAEPAINLQTGQLEPWLGQFLLRLTGYVGPVTAGSSKTTNLTLTQQIAAAAALAASANAPLPMPPAKPPAPAAFPLLTGQVVLQSGAVISDGFLGSPTDGPNSILPGNVGDVFLQRDGTLATGVVWLKLSGYGTTTGWVSAVPDVDLGITATGTNFATSYSIKRAKTIFSTVAAGTGAALPVPIPGDCRKIMNSGTNPLLVWPGTSISIGTGAAGASTSVPVGGSLTLDAETTTLWFPS